MLLFFTAISNAQKNTVDYIAYSDNTYYEILKQKKSVTVIRYYLNESNLTRDTLNFISVKEVQQKLHFKTLLKTRKLQKESTFFRNVDLGRSQQKSNLGDLANTEILEKDWYLHKRIGLDFKTDTLYTFQFHKNGSKELWYLSGNDSLDLYNRFWCKHKNNRFYSYTS